MTAKEKRSFRYHLTLCRKEARVYLSEARKRIREARKKGFDPNMHDFAIIDVQSRMIENLNEAISSLSQNPK